MTREMIHGSGSPPWMTRGGHCVIRGTPGGGNRGTGVPIRGTSRRVIHGTRPAIR
jgi:hypothetical protein